MASKFWLISAELALSNGNGVAEIDTVESN